MFLSQYNSQFQKLDVVQQQHIIGLSGVVVAVVITIIIDNGDDDNNGDIIVPLLNISSCNIMRAAAFHWRIITNNTK